MVCLQTSLSDLKMIRVFMGKIKARFTLQKIFGTVREKFYHGCLKRARQTLFTLHHFYRIKNTVPKFLGPGKFSCRHAQFNYNQERPRDFGGE